MPGPDAKPTLEGSPGSRLKMRRRLSGDLDAIVLMALRKEPQRRYASVEQMSSDVHRYLQGLPVAAAPDSLRYRGRKFVGRHKVGVAATLLILLIVFVGVLATVREAKIAAANQRRAEHHFNDVRKLANSLIFELHDSIRDLPGATSARKLIIEKAVEYLDSLATEARDDPSLQRELAHAYQRIGDVQGGPFAANVGDITGALKSYQNAISIRQSLLASGGGNTEDLIGLAEVFRLQASAHTVNGNIAGALENTQRAVKILEDALASDSDDLNLKKELMLDYGAEADLFASFLIASNFGNLSSALPLRRKQLEIAEQLAALQPQDQGAQRNLASALNLMGDQLLLTGERRESAPFYERAGRLLEPMAAESSNTQLLLELHDSYYRQVPVEIASGELDRSVNLGRRALAISRNLTRSDPQNTQALLIMAADLCDLADALARAGRKAEALNATAEALAIDIDLAHRYPKNREFRHMRPSRYQGAGDVYRRFGQYQQALHYHQQGAQILHGMRAEDPANKWTSLRLAAAYNGIGGSLRELNDLAGAARAFRASLDLTAQDVASETPSQDALYISADSAAGLGEVERNRAKTSPDRRSRIVHLQQALSWYETSLKTWRRVKEPGLVSPAEFDCTPLSVVETQNARLRQELAALRVPGLR